MILRKPEAKLLSRTSTEDLREQVESAGRTAYLSYNKADLGSDKFTRMLLSKGHLSPFRHAFVAFKLTVDRGVSHELVRHHAGVDFVQESTRYCNYSRSDIHFIIPPWLDIPTGKYHLVSEGIFSHSINPSITDMSDGTREKLGIAQEWLRALYSSECAYIKLSSLGWSPQQARSVLPNALKTELHVTANIEAWKNILDARLKTAAHPQTQEIMALVAAELARLLPEVFSVYT